MNPKKRNFLGNSDLAPWVFKPDFGSSTILGIIDTFFAAKFNSKNNFQLSDKQIIQSELFIKFLISCRLIEFAFL